MKKTYLFGLLIIALIALSACQKPVASIMPGQQGMMQNDAMQSDDAQAWTPEEMEAMENEMGSEMMEDHMSANVLAGTTTKYLAFDKIEYDKARMANKIILLKFYANWCPSCQAEESEIYSAVNSLNNPNLVIFRVNYKDTDTDSYETELAKDFGITVQHTKVLLKNGKVALKSLETWTAERYLSEIRAVAE